MSRSPRIFGYSGFDSRFLASLFLAATLFFFSQLQPARAGEPSATGTTNRSPAARLTTAEQVHWLTRQQAAGAQPVLIRGVITCALPAFNAAVVQDATAGIYIDNWNTPPGGPPRPGQLVEVEGVTDPGQFAPRIHATRINSVGTSDLPAPVRPYWDQLINGSLDTRFVEIEGVLTAVRSEGVKLLTHGGSINALIYDPSGAPDSMALKQFEGGLVRLRGCLFASWDPVSHEVNVSEVRMFSPSVTMLEPPPADAFAAPQKSVADLLQFDPRASSLRSVKVSGQIVHHRAAEFYAMDGTNGFRFIPKESTTVMLGDLVEVVGFPSLTGPSPVLQEAQARKTGVAPLPEARPLDAASLFRAKNDATRVSLQAMLLNVSRDQRSLELQAGLQRFVARLENPEPVTPGTAARRTPGPGGKLDLPPGSRLALIGVYAGTGGSLPTDTDVANFELLLNSPVDIRVLMRPPFWTLQTLLVLVGALLGGLTLALVWIRLLHHRVQQRTAQLQKETNERQNAEHQRVLAHERARIARDLHDDLGTSLTEISMLATASPGLELPQSEATERMQTIAGKSRTLVYALDELVWAVDPERDTLASVARYLASYAEEYLAGLKVACRVHIPNEFPAQVVSGRVRHHLFLAVKEALNNAVRHGAATEIEFRVRLLENRLLILISDNGAGFDTVGRSNGHGLLNLRSRLQDLHGVCEVESSPGAGTTICLQLPLPVPK